MSDILATAGAVLSKTRYAWSIPCPALEPAPPLPVLEGDVFVNKKTHSTQDVPGALPGDYAGDHNKTAQHKATQLNQGRRTPGSRSDRDDHLGSDNQSRRRKSGPGQGR